MTTRILYVEGNTDGTVGGSHIILLDLVLALDRSAYEPIVVFCEENIIAERLRGAGVRVEIIGPAKAFVFAQESLNVLLSPVKKVVNFFRGFLMPALSYAKFLRHERIDLVNLNNSITVNHSWMLASLLSRTPCVTHEMGLAARYSFIARTLGARLDAVICLSQAILDGMRAGGVDFPRAIVIHPLFDAKRYRHVESPDDLRRKHRIPADAPVVGVVGNVRPWKGQETIVRAMQILARRYPTIRCVLAGGSSVNDAEYRQRLESLCVELGITEQVVFAGFQENAIDYMRLMDVVAHTSTSPEPFGIVLLEAMLLGKPLVSTTIGGPAEIVINGVTGLLVDPGKPELLAEAIDALLRDKVAATEMGRRGQARLAKEFALERTVAETLRLYDRVLSLHGARAKSA